MTSKESVSGMKPKAMPSSSSILLRCVLDVIDLDVIPEGLLDVIHFMFQAF